MKTAVEFLIEKTFSDYGKSVLRQEIKMALEMEKQQIIDAYGVGHNEGCSYMTDGKTEFKDAEQYYNEQFKKD